MIGCSKLVTDMCSGKLERRNIPARQYIYIYRIYYVIIKFSYFRYPLCELE